MCIRDRCRVAQQTKGHAGRLCHCRILDIGHGIGHYVHFPFAGIRSLFYDRKLGYGEAFDNVQMNDTVNKNMLTGKKLSQIARDIEDEYGAIHMEERDYKFSQEKKDQIYDTLLIQKQLPEMDLEIDKISYLDGCKVYFKNGGWIIARFSGTEPLLRIFCEMGDPKDAIRMCECFEEFLNIKGNRN